MNNTYLFPALRMTPGLIKKAFDQIPESEWDTPTAPDRFTPREVLAHLADWEPILLLRLKLCVEHPGSEITPWDEGQMAIDHGYASWSPAESIAKYEAARAETLAWLGAREPSDWGKSANHPERGVQTVADIANSLACHDVYHIEQLS